MQAACQVEFPAGTDPGAIQRPIAVIAWLAACQLAKRAFQRLVLRDNLRIGATNRPQRRIRQMRHGARLLNPGQGGRQVEILREHALDDAGQHRIVEMCPPGFQRGRRGRGCRPGMVKGLRHGRCRPHIVGADGAGRERQCRAEQRGCQACLARRYGDRAVFHEVFLELASRPDVAGSEAAVLPVEGWRWTTSFATIFCNTSPRWFSVSLRKVAMP